MPYNHDHFIDLQMKAMVGHALFWKYEMKSLKISFAINIDPRLSNVIFKAIKFIH